MDKLDAAISVYQSGEDSSNFLERPKWKGHPSRAMWKQMSDIITDNMSVFDHCENPYEISDAFDDLMRSYGISLPSKVYENIIPWLIDRTGICPDDSCFLMTSDKSILFDYIGMTGNEALHLLAFQSNQFKELTKKQQISFLLSHVSLVKEIYKQFKFYK